MRGRPKKLDPAILVRRPETRELMMAHVQRYGDLDKAASAVGLTRSHLVQHNPRLHDDLTFEVARYLLRKPGAEASR